MKKTLYYFPTPLSGNRYFLFHTLLFDYIVLDSNEFAYWQKDLFERFPPNIHDELCDKRFIVDNGDDVLLNDALAKFSDKSHLPPSFAIYITNKCNLCCRFCFTGYELKKQYGQLTIQNIHAIFSAIDDIISIHNSYFYKGLPTISIFGGEPLLRSNKYLLDEVFKLLKYRNLRVEIVSNLIYAKYFYDIFTYYEKELHFKVTFVGDKSYHNTIRCDAKASDIYTQQIKHIIHLLEHVPNSLVNISLLLDKNNINLPLISSLINDLENNKILTNARIHLGFGLIQFRTLYEGDNYKDNILSPTDYYPKLLDIIKNINSLSDIKLSGSPFHIFANIYDYWFKNIPFVPSLSGCDAVTPGRYCFYPDGKVYPCFDAVGIQSMSIADYVNGFKFNPERHNAWKRFCLKKTKCFRCKFIAICNGGCLITNFFRTGNINIPDCLPVEDALEKFINYLDTNGKFNDNK